MRSAPARVHGAGAYRIGFAGRRLRRRSPSGNGTGTQCCWVRNTPLSIYQRVTDINYYGNISLTLALLPSLRPGSQVAVVSSINGLLSDKCSSAYAAAKHALLGFYDALRAEQPELVVSVIAPGFVAPPITVNSINGSGQTYGERSEASLTGMSVDRFSPGPSTPSNDIGP